MGFVAKDSKNRLKGIADQGREGFDSMIKQGKLQI
jgi:hypothetical protein